MKVIAIAAAEVTVEWDGNEMKLAPMKSPDKPGSESPKQGDKNSGGGRKENGEQKLKRQRGMRGQMGGDISPEERQQMREKMARMSPEERKEYMKKMRDERK